MIDWTSVGQYLMECNNYAESEMSETGNIPKIDEAVTKGLEGLRGLHGLDLDDEAVAHALIVGFLVAYQHGCQTAMNNERDPVMAQVYLRFHGPISGNIGLVARTIARNFGVSIPTE